MKSTNTHVLPPLIPPPSQSANPSLPPLPPPLTPNPYGHLTEKKQRKQKTKKKELKINKKGRHLFFLSFPQNEALHSTGRRGGG